jgi:hypothetical protein
VGRAFVRLLPGSLSWFCAVQEATELSIHDGSTSLTTRLRFLIERWKDWVYEESPRTAIFQIINQKSRIGNAGGRWEYPIINFE